MKRCTRSRTAASVDLPWASMNKEQKGRHCLFTMGTGSALNTLLYRGGGVPFLALFPFLQPTFLSVNSGMGAAAMSPTRQIDI